MGFARQEINEDDIQWNRIQAQLENADDHDPEEPLLIDGLVTHARKVDEDDEEIAEPEDADEDQTRQPPPRAARAPHSAPRPPQRTTPKVASESVAAKRLPQIRASAERLNRIKGAAIDPGNVYRAGKVLFIPSLQRFGTVVYSSAGYIRLQMRDGSQATLGKPPLEDRRNFVIANFDRMDNRAMAELLEISVHTMRRLCHEFGLKRHGRERDSHAARKSA